jgi:hypothetical protein
MTPRLAVSRGRLIPFGRSAERVGWRSLGSAYQASRTVGHEFRTTRCDVMPTLLGRCWMTPLSARRPA